MPLLSSPVHSRAVLMIAQFFYILSGTLSWVMPSVLHTMFLSGSLQFYLCCLCMLLLFMCLPGDLFTCFPHEL